MPNLTTLQFIACALMGLIAILGIAGYVVLCATPKDEEEPEIPAKSGYLADLDGMDTEFL